MVIIALIAGLLLFVTPGLWLLDFSGILKHRSSAGFVFLGLTSLATYGLVFFGVAVSWLRASRAGRPFRSSKIFVAGMLSLLTAWIVYFVGGGIYGVAKYGSFAKAIGGNLWGLLVIFWGVLGTFVSAGLALLFYAWRGPGGPTGAGPGTGPWSSPPTI